jgi:hypothetical protein
MHGESIRATFNQPDSPNPRDAQYFELWASRGIWENPHKLEELKKLWWAEAAKNGALPQLEAGGHSRTYDQALE